MLEALHFYRLAHQLHRRRLRLAARVVTRLGRLFGAAHIDPAAEIGPRCTFGYGGLGVIIHGAARVGADVLISPGVVLGGRSSLAGAPVIGDGVKIGAGAKVLGPIRVGARAQIGANAVVIDDVPPGVTVAGIPARPLARQ